MFHTKKWIFQPRKSYLIILKAVLLVGCQSQPFIKTTTLTPSEAQRAGLANITSIESRIKQYPEDTDMSLTERFAPSRFTLGSWIVRDEGLNFSPVPAQNNNVAILYLYRPDSEWNAQEIIAPNFYLNNQRIHSLTNNHYYWMEMPAGDYRLSIRRPLGIFNFQKGLHVDFKVEAGNTYYLRYDEQGIFRMPDPALNLLKKGAIAQIPAKQALEELRSARLKTPGYSFVPLIDKIENAPNLANVTGSPSTKVPNRRIEEIKEPELTKPFKIWNPLTW